MIDVSKALEGMELEEFRISPWDPHPTALGHQAIFEAVKQELERHGGLPGLPFQ